MSQTTPPPPQTWSPPPPPGAKPRRSVALIVTVILLVIALALASTIAVVQTSRLSDSRDTIAELRQQAEDDAARIEQLQQALEERPGAQPDTSTDPLEELFGEGGLEELFGEGGLEGLFGEGGLGELFGESSGVPQVNDCVTGVEDLPDVTGEELDEQFTEAADAVEDLRGREFPEPITPTIKTGEEIRAFLDTEIREEYPAEQADQDLRILAGLRAVPADLDLVGIQTELLGDQVIGYYDDETRELVVRAEDPEAKLGAIGLITLAHELEHALVDATVGLPPLDDYGSDDDAAVAALSVVEGSAVALQSQFQISAMDPMALLGDLGAVLGAQQGLDEVPYYIAQSLTFPYVVGPTYVCGLYGEGGWDAVDEAIREPPATTHQIMFPAAGGDPVDVPDPAGPEGYEPHEQRTFGAAQLSWLFGAPGGDEPQALADPVAAVEPWRGGEVNLWTSGADSAIGLVLAGEGLCDPVTRWWTAAAGGPEGQAEGNEQVVRQTADQTWGVVTCDGGDVRVGVGPTADVARAAITS